MCKYYCLLILGLNFSFGRLYSQATLPDFTLKNTNGVINILWLNQYPKQVKGITVQRSHDSLSNFTSIASVINPQNTINGFSEIKPPSKKMYYRLFIAFDTGMYIFTGSKKPEPDSVIDYTALINVINNLYKKNIQPQEEKAKAKNAAALLLPVKKTNSSNDKTVNKENTTPTNEADEKVVIEEVITYPSKRIFTDKEDNIVINLPNTRDSSYLIKFFTEDNKKLFEVKNLQDDYVVIEKVNFIRAGWYTFEIYKNGILLEENKFFIPGEEKLKPLK